MTRTSRYLLRLLGGASIEGPEGALTGRPAQKNALALMAVLATAPDRTLPRETITARLWPERDGKRARHLLNVTSYEIRKSLGQDALVTANGNLRLNPDIVASDIERFGAAVEAEKWDRAAELYAGPFLDGFHTNGSEPFERWVERERWRYERLYRTVLERRAEQAGDPATAAERWRELLERDPTSATATIGLMCALEATGRRAEAIDIAHAHRILMLEEYGADPNPDVEKLADRLREEPAANGLPVTNGIEAAETAPATGESPPRNRFPSLPRQLAAVAGAGFVGLALIWLVSESRTPSPDSFPYADDRVLVAGFDNRTHDAGLDHLGEIATDFIAQELFRSGLVEVVPSTVAAIAPDEDAEEAIRGLIDRTGAGLVVRGAFTARGDSLWFHAQILDARSGRLLRAIENVRGSVDTPLAIVEELRARTVGALATLVDPRLTEWADMASQPPSYEAYVHFTTGLDRFARREYVEAAGSFRTAADLEGGFLSPLVWEATSYRSAMWRNQVHLDFDMGARADSLIEVLRLRSDELAPWDRAMVEYFSTRSTDDIRAIHDALQEVTRLSRDPRWTIELATYTYYLNRPTEAKRILDSVDLDQAAERVHGMYLVTAVNVHHVLGEFEQELEVARRWRERKPRANMVRMYELRALAALGRTDEVEQGLEDFLEATPWANIFFLRELEIHGLDALARHGLAYELALFRERPAAERDEMWGMGLANLLYLTGDLEGARAEWERLLRETDFSDNHAPYIGGLGRIAARTGDRETALRMERRLVETDWSGVFYGGLPRIIAHQRAQIAALLGEHDRALEILRDVYEGGSYREAHIRTMNPDLDVLIDRPDYQRLAMAGG